MDNKKEMIKSQLSSPKLRFEGFRDKWDCYRFENTIKIIRGERITKHQISNSDTYPVMSGGKSMMGYYNKFNRLSNTITMCQYGAAGFVNFIKTNFWANDVCISFIPCEKLDNLFLYYLMSFMQKYWYSLVNKHATPHSISIDKIAKTIFSSPTLLEQQKIAHFFSLLDKRIEKMERKLELYEIKMKYYLSKMFVKGNKELPELRFKEFSDVWCENKISYFFKENKKIKNNFGKRLSVKLNFNGIEERKFKASERIGATNQYIRNAGEFIYGKQNIHKGSIGIIPNCFDGYVSSGDIPSFFKIKEINTSFFYFYIMVICCDFESYMTGTGSKRLKSEAFLNFLFKSPTKYDEQRKISIFFEKHLKIIESIKEDIKYFEINKKFYLNKMFI